MAVQTIKVSLNTDLDSAKCGVIDVETTGFQGKGCGAIHAMFAGIGEMTKIVKKPEYRATQQQPVQQR